jgi:hypothetical protein
MSGLDSYVTEGRNAHAAGIAAEANPYRDFERACAWTFGWFAAAGNMPLMILMQGQVAGVAAAVLTDARAS